MILQSNSIACSGFLLYDLVRENFLFFLVSLYILYYYNYYFEIIVLILYIFWISVLFHVLFSFFWSCKDVRILFLEVSYLFGLNLGNILDILLIRCLHMFFKIYCLASFFRWYVSWYFHLDKNVFESQRDVSLNKTLFVTNCSFRRSNVVRKILYVTCIFY